MFRNCFAGRPYPRDTRKNNSLTRLFSFQLCAPHVAFSRLSFSRNPLILHLSLSLHQLNTKPNTIKSHKVQGYKLKQLQHFLLWNKANIKHSCKSQLYSLDSIYLLRFLGVYVCILGLGVTNLILDLLSGFYLSTLVLIRGTNVISLHFIFTLLELMSSLLSLVHIIPSLPQ